MQRMTMIRISINVFAESNKMLNALPKLLHCTSLSTSSSEH